MKRLTLYALSFFTNAVILIFEITGGRLLAPFLSTAVEVWAGLIAVILGAMAVGYHFGGRVADTDASQKTIGTTLLFAGAATILSWGMRDAVPTWFGVQDIPLTVSAFLVGLLLFAPSTALLAAVTPMIAKNLLHRLDHSARVVGYLNTAGTVGAIAGAVTTSMLLLSWFSTGGILLGLAILLGIAGIVISKDVRRSVEIFAACAVVAFFLNGLPAKTDGLIADVSSPYNRIFVTYPSPDSNVLAVSTTPSGFQCGMYVNNGVVDENHLAIGYVQMYDVAIDELLPQGPRRMLSLGGCVEGLSRYMVGKHQSLTLDSIEIDRKMTEIAEKYFGFEAERFPRLHIIYEDARRFVNRPHEPYDVIVMDAWGSSGRPQPHLVTREMFQGMANSLSDNGIMIFNVIGAYGSKTSYISASTLETARAVFPHAEFYRHLDTPQKLQNLILIASKDLTLPERIENGPYLLQKTEPAAQGIVFTDNFAPIEGFTDWKSLTEK